MGRAAAVRANTKARTDGAKAKKYNLYAKKLLIAVKSGGGADPEVNRQLNQVISDAKAAQVPKDVIQRNIDKAANAGTGADFKQSIFEFYGFGGVGILVNVLTDNDNRASAEVNLVAKKAGLKSAAMNSVKFKFTYKARLDVAAVLNEDELLEKCLEAGVDDYSLYTKSDGGVFSPEEEGKSVVVIDLKDLGALRDTLRAQGLVVEANVAAFPNEGFLAVSEEDMEKNEAAFLAFESLDDVDSIEHNIDMTVDDN